MDCGILKDIFGFVSQLCTGPACYIFQLEENLETLKNSMDELTNLSLDFRTTLEAQETNARRRTNQVQGWLRRIEEMKLKVGEILTEGDGEIAARCVGGFCSKNCYASYKLARRVERKRKEVDELKGKIREALPLQAPFLETPPPSVIEVPTVPITGMDSIFNEAWCWISKERAGIMGIHGMGGVGKTALLKRINNEFRHQGTLDFDVVIWVVVSREVCETKIQDDVAKRLNLSLPSGESLQDRAHKLYDALRCKKFVLLLDDVWDRVNFEAIGIPHPNINNKSMVIFTTRLESVCGLMDAKKITVECLDWSEAWNLFEEKAGKEAINSDNEIRSIAEDVAKMCAGLPLALITVGRAMFCKRTRMEWIHASILLKKSESELLGMTKEVYPILKQSYDSLANNVLRSCFLYCSLFPDKFSIEIDQLVRYWIGEGFLDGSDGIEQAKFSGYDIIVRLKEAGLLKITRDQNSTTENLMMHVVLRGLALWIGCDYGENKDKFLVQAGIMLGEVPEVGKWRGAERISIMNNDIQTLGDDVPTCPNLLTLIIAGNNFLTKICNCFFQYMSILKVLDLAESGIEEFPRSIVHLVGLQYLSLAGTNIERLPQEMNKLDKLKCLDLSNTKCLTFIPCGTLSRLSVLQVLDVGQSSFKHWRAESCVGQDDEYGGASIEELECLKYLRYLSIIITNSASFERLRRSRKFTRCEVHVPRIMT